eukprot:3866463-Prymnesium_polylepis.1
MPSTDKPRADSVESTSKELTTASLRRATTKEEAGPRKGQHSSPGNFGPSGHDLEESPTSLFAASIAKDRCLRKPEPLSSRPSSTPDAPTKRNEMPQPAGRGLGGYFITKYPS